MLYELPLTIAVEADSFDEAKVYLQESIDADPGMDRDDHVQWVRLGISDEALTYTDVGSFTRADGKVERIGNADEFGVLEQTPDGSKVATA